MPQEAQREVEIALVVNISGDVVVLWMAPQCDDVFRPDFLSKWAKRAALPLSLRLFGIGMR